MKILKNKEYKELQKKINIHEKFIQAVQSGSVKKARDIIIQAIQEGERIDILTPLITQAAANGSAYIDKNNYLTYAGQLQMAYDMYDSKSTYGSELYGPIIDTRVSFICGSGVSIKGAKAATAKFINKLLKENKMLKGSNILESGKITEMEGKILWKIDAKKEDGKISKIKITPINYHKYPYGVECEHGEIKEIYTGKKEENKKIIPLDQAVFIKTGGSPGEYHETVPRVSKVLTDIENLSRAKYDMRGNNHLYARPMWYALTETIQEAKAINSLISGQDMSRKKSYAGTAKSIGYLEPDGNAQDSIVGEITALARIISTATGIPIHWLAYPDLMSNRATAENMLEIINASTVQERTRMEEGLKELIQKCMVKAVEWGIEGAVNDPDGFEVKLDFVSYAALKQIQETWIPLAESEYISKETVKSLVPGVDPYEENKLLKKEKEERMKLIPETMKYNIEYSGEEYKKEEIKNE